MSERTAPHQDTEFDPERVVIRDRRRLDPLTGLPRETAAAPPPAGDAPDGPTAEAAAPDGPDPVAELTADLKRLSAEYANYRKRVQRDQAAVVELATAALVDRLLPLLDDVDRARAHGDLEGAFKVVGEGLEVVVGKLGVERYGAPGDVFDPQVHQAVLAAPQDPTVDVATCAQVFAPGYRFAGGRVVRPAQVAVAEPAGPVDPEPAPEA